MTGAPKLEVHSYLENADTGRVMLLPIRECWILLKRES